MNKMRSIFIFIVCAALLLGLAACGGGEPSGETGVSQPAGESTASPAGEDTPVSEASAPAAPAMDLDAVLAAMVEAAELGNTINVSEIDLKAGGVNTDNVESFAGAQSQLAAQNGGIVIVMKAVSGTAADVAADMEGFREYSLGNADYEEFEAARNNTRDGVIKTFGDYVVYAVSATGNADAVSAAAEAQFA